MQHETGRIEVDLTAIERNVAVLREALAPSDPAGPPPGLCAVLKADAYGLGAARVAKRLGILGIEMIAVYSLDEARDLVDAALPCPTLVLSPVHGFDRSDTLYRAAWREKLHLTVHDAENLAAVGGLADRLGVVVPLHLAVDTGMGREGALPEEALELARAIDAHRRLRLAGVYTHFASADSDDALTREQHARFAAWLDEAGALIPEGCLVHESNTFGVFRGHALHGSMVRVGLGLLGYAAEEFAEGEPFELRELASRLRPAMRWIATVSQVKRVPAGHGASYGATWRAKRPSVLGVVPVGYADGYPLGLSNRAKVGVTLSDGSKVYAPVVGRVSMDQIVVDLTDLPEGEARAGVPVELVGCDRSAPNHLPTLAAAAGTITHELLCRVSARVPRTYVALEEARMSDRESLRYIDAHAKR